MVQRWTKDASISPGHQVGQHCQRMSGIVGHGLAPNFNKKMLNVPRFRNFDRIQTPKIASIHGDKESFTNNNLIRNLSQQARPMIK